MAELEPNEHESNESDEDCEAYFLKPVNDYNIVEKIKEANKELFAERNADANISSAINNDQSVDLVAIRIDPQSGAPFRKVTFAPNLENYEPDSTILEALKLTHEFDETAVEAKTIDCNLHNICNFETIIEEIPDTNTSTSATSKQTETAPSTEMAGASITNTELVDAAENSVVEEICEEIVVMDMENEDLQPLTTNVHTSNQRRMVKLRTFDCAEQDPPEVEFEQDNKSMVNLLTSDGEEECCSAATFDINVDNSDLDVDDIEVDASANDGDANADPNSDNKSVSNIEDYDDDDGDDDISLIVASYLPNDFEPTRLSSGHKKQANNSRRLNVPFNKRFSFPHKPLLRNSIGTSSTAGDNNTSTLKSNASSRRHQSLVPPPEVTELKLNYRTCCEYRRHLSQPEKLPKYTGYLSEYGLSRKQLEQREDTLERKQRHALQHTLNANEMEMQKMQDNERAFIKWLRNKMRFPINKTRNMFDVKRRNLSTGVGSAACGGNTVARNTRANGQRMSQRSPCE